MVSLGGHGNLPEWQVKSIGGVPPPLSQGKDLLKIIATLLEKENKVAKTCIGHIILNSLGKLAKPLKPTNQAPVALQRLRLNLQHQRKF